MHKQTRLFPILELLEELSPTSKLATDFESTLLVGVQHLNETTGSLVERLLAIGFKPQNIHLLGKSYSTNYNSLTKIRALGCSAESSNFSAAPGSFVFTNQNLIFQLWYRISEYISKNQIKKIIVLDDGGRLIGSIPESLAALEIICIEQTTKGIRNKKVINSRYPVISVAQSFSKLSFESHIIASAVVFKIQQYLTLNSKIGIIGKGNIGTAVFRKLDSLGYNVSSFDINDQASTLKEIVCSNDFILGCTGYRLDLKKEWFENSFKYLASCSSEDVEFSNIFSFNLPYTLENSANSAPHIIYRNPNLILLNSGFPINFDNSKEIEEEKDIQITRALILSALLQALTYANLPSGLNSISFKYEEKIQNYINKSKSSENAEAI